MSEAQENAHGTAPGAETPDAKPRPVIHRVCIQCNNMFVVTMDRYEAKQCPNCHKG